MQPLLIFIGFEIVLMFLSVSAQIGISENQRKKSKSQHLLSQGSKEVHMYVNTVTQRGLPQLVRHMIQALMRRGHYQSVNTRGPLCLAPHRTATADPAGSTSSPAHAFDKPVAYSLWQSAGAYMLSGLFDLFSLNAGA